MADQTSPETETGPVAWRIRVREGNSTFHIYTERLPYDPGTDRTVVLGEPQPMYLAQSSQETGELLLELTNEIEGLKHDLNRYMAASPVLAQRPADGCPINMTDPSICSAGCCQRCSDWRDGWNAALSDTSTDRNGK